MARKVNDPGVGTGHGRKIQRERTCGCGAAFMAARSDALCPVCRAESRRQSWRRSDAKTKWDSCPQCGGRKFYQAEHCLKCRINQLNDQRGDKNPMWRGGRINHHGYIRIRTEGQPGRTRYTGEHVLIWEAANGPVPPKWHVHHLNGVKDDNRIENLIALSPSDHHSSKGLVPYEARILALETRLREHNLPVG